MLRERGQSEEAERLRVGELMTMVASARTPTDSDAVIDERLNAIFATESERVANAAVLAELLLPMIAGQVQPGSVTTASPMVATTSLAAKPATEKPVPVRAASIADFIDEMIAQEKPPPRSDGGTQRRAS